MISVIVPAYQAQPYLDTCIGSILMQTEAALELLLIDDGSTDSTAEICRRRAAADPRVVLLRQPHSGVSAARNTGMEAARGEYITFVDADDLLQKDILRQARLQAENRQSDLVLWNACTLQSGQRYFCSPVTGPVPEKSALQAAVISGMQPAGFPLRYLRPVWGKLFRRDCIVRQALRFREDLAVGEDAIFLLQYLSAAETVTMLNEYGYLYRILPGSALRRARPDLLQQSRLQLEALQALYPDAAAAPMEHAAIRAFAWHTLRILYDNSRACVQAGILPSAARNADTESWYFLLREIDRTEAGTAFAPDRLTRLQMRLGCRVPVQLQLLPLYLRKKTGTADPAV